MCLVSGPWLSSLFVSGAVVIKQDEGNCCDVDDWKIFIQYCMEHLYNCDSRYFVFIVYLVVTIHLVIIVVNVR